MNIAHRRAVGRLRRAAGVLAVTALWSLASPAAAAGDALSGERIRALIVGNTLVGPWYAKLYDFSYTAEGAIYGSTGFSTDGGSWRIRDGNVYCHHWSTFFGGDERCYRWYDDGGGRYTLKNVDSYRVYDLYVWRIEPGMGF